MMKGRFFRACLTKWRKMGTKILPSANSDDCCKWALWPCMYEDESIPKDVPRGHLVVYVGEDYKRFVIEVTLLKHPLFRALLDQAKEENDFTYDEKFWIPCDENIFLDVICCVNAPPERRFLCL